MNGRDVRTFYGAHRVHLRVVYGSQNKQQLMSLNSSGWRVLITEMERVYCAVKPGRVFDPRPHYVRFLVDKFCTDIGFSLSTTISSYQYHAINTPYSSSSTRCCCRKDERTKPGNKNKKTKKKKKSNGVSEIGKHWIEKVLSLFSTLKV